MKHFTFNSAKNLRRKILNENQNVDSFFIQGKNNILITIPHGVSQTRLGKYKFAEIGTIPMGVYLGTNTQSNILIKTKNNFDDANFDKDCNYRKKLNNIIKKHNIKYLIDLHGLAPWRDCDINLGTNIGKNIENNIDIYDNLNNLLSTSFKVKTDEPFMASGNTISCSVKRNFNIWTIQIETNCSITNYKENIEKFNTLLEILIKWVKSIDENKN